MLRAGKNRQKQNKNRTTQKQLSLESLEDRRLMAVDISLTKGLLSIEGDSQHDVVKVMQVAPQRFTRGNTMGLPMVQVWHGHREGGQTVFDGSSNFVSFFVHKISFNGNDGNDLFDNQTAIKSEAHGGWGVDLLRGGSNHDKLFGEGDGDYLYGNAGNDYLVGGGGFDRLSGGEGDDRLRGSGDMNGYPYNDNMHDYLSGGPGFDQVVDEVLGNAELTNTHLKLSSFSGGVVEYNMINNIESVRLIGKDLDNTIDASQYSDGKVFVDGGEGDDTIIGSQGNDLLLGGQGNDSIRGEGGNDLITGAAGNDVLEGNAGHDILVGNQGDDLLRGDAGNDLLVGSEGDDTLYGGAGTDNLSGNSGNDGLFGGGDSDTLSGDSGQDRFLTQEGDVMTDKSPEDAEIVFKDGKQDTFNVGGSNKLYTAKAWSDDDIERVDVVFSKVHSLLGNTTLLKTGKGDTQTFHRHGTTFQGFAGNDGIHLTDLQFNGGENWLRGYVLHEMGHSWHNGDDPDQEDFQALGGWTQTDPNDAANFTQVGSWWFKTNANFVSAYAKTGWKEDFAESFSAYFMDQFGWAFYNGGGGANAAPDKMALIDNFVTSQV